MRGGAGREHEGRVKAWLKSVVCAYNGRYPADISRYAQKKFLAHLPSISNSPASTSPAPYTSHTQHLAWARQRHRYLEGGASRPLAGSGGRRTTARPRELAGSIGRPGRPRRRSAGVMVRVEHGARAARHREFAREFFLGEFLLHN